VSCAEAAMRVAAGQIPHPDFCANYGEAEFDTEAASGPPSLVDMTDVLALSDSIRI